MPEGKNYSVTSAVRWAVRWAVVDASDSPVDGWLKSNIHSGMDNTASNFVYSAVFREVFGVHRKGRAVLHPALQDFLHEVQVGR